MDKAMNHFFIKTCLVMLGISFLSNSIAETTSSTAPEEKTTTKIEITSNNFRVDRKAGSVFYKNKVVLTWGEIKIHANKLSRQTIQQKASKTTNKASTDSTSTDNEMTDVEIIEAEGSPVVLTFTDPKTNKTIYARGNQFKFMPASNSMELTDKATLTVTDLKRIETDIKARWIKLNLTSTSVDRIKARGKPVRYSHTPKQGEGISAKANSLDLFYKTKNVHLLSATITQGADTFKAESITYNGDNGQFHASGQGENRPSTIIEVETPTSKDDSSNLPVEDNQLENMPKEDPKKKLQDNTAQNKEQSDSENRPQVPKLQVSKI